MDSTKKKDAIQWRPPAALRARIEALAGQRGVALTKVITELVERGLSITTGENVKAAPRKGARTDYCPHRRPPGQYCSRCDVEPLEKKKR